MKFRISNFSYHIINSLCNKPETSVSKEFLINAKKLSFDKRILASSQFLYNELPIRFSRRIKELEKLPIDLENDHEIFIIRDWYVKSLDEVTNHSYPKSNEDCHSFRNTIKNIFDRHSSTLTTMSTGISKLNTSNNFNSFLTKFYYNRTRTRFLITNYLEYFQNNEDKIGLLYFDCNLNSLLNEVCNDVESLVDLHDYKMPEINIDLPDIKITYPKGYLYYSLLEIIKNSIVALKNVNDAKISISCNHDDNLIVLKIKDNGIGINDDNMDNIWKFSFSTSKINFQDKFSKDFEKSNPISGFGYGLPISRILLRTFNGDLKIFSKKGKGTEIYMIIDINSNWKF